jgi:outer membrane protein assembly factor BamE (lipoprotein component of BamABCDE complex)
MTFRDFLHSAVLRGNTAPAVSKRLLIAALFPALALAGCMTAPEHRAAVTEDAADRLTAGRVQKEIRIGMSGAEVAQALGSPNIVTTDEQRREVWIYDKIATEAAHSTSSGGISALILGFGTSAAALAGPSVSGTSGASAVSQRTLTVIIKYDQDRRVRDFAYHTSRF